MFGEEEERRRKDVYFAKSIKFKENKSTSISQVVMGVEA